MIKDDLSRKISKKFNLSIAESQRIIDFSFYEIRRELKKNKRPGKTSSEHPYNLDIHQTFSDNVKYFSHNLNKENLQLCQNKRKKTQKEAKMKLEKVSVKEEQNFNKIAKIDEKEIKKHIGEIVRAL